MGLDKLEVLLASEATAALATALSMQSLVDHPVSVAPLGNGVLVALGPKRYVNRAIGVGPELGVDDIAAIERFYTNADLPPSLQLSSAATDDSLALLSEAGFRPSWFRGLHATALPSDGPTIQPARADSDASRIVTVDKSNLDDWLATLAMGNQVSSPTARAISDEFCLAMHRAHGSTDFLALDDDDEPIGCGSVQVADGIAWLGGAATIPGARGQGVQTALLHHRLRFASSLGCAMAAATARPLTTSARNLARSGMTLVDTQLVLTQR